MDRRIIPLIMCGGAGTRLWPASREVFLPGGELPEQVANRVLDESVDDLRKCLGLAIGHHARRRLIRCAAPRDHVGSDRPRRATESDQRDPRIEFTAYPAQRLEYQLELGEIPGRGKCANLVRRVQGIEPRSFADFEPDVATQRIGDDENIREDDRGVEIETADRLQRYFGSEFWCEAEIEKAAGPGANVAVFGQVAAGLTHHPERRNRLPPPGKHFQQRFDGWSLCQAAFPFLADNYDCQS